MPRKLATLTLVLLLTICTSAFAEEKLNVLIIDGQNNHNWKATTPILQRILEDAGLFKVEVATSPADDEEFSKWSPDFSTYDVVLSNYNGKMWPDAMREGFEKFVADGGGVVIVHAANNAFSGWKEYNKIIGLGWRGAGFGDRVTFNDEGKTVRTTKGDGPGAGHGPQHDFTIIVRDDSHPVTKGMPREWLHAKDELYHGQRGPAANMEILATAYSAKDKGGTGAHEPMIWVIPFGKGRVFTTVMGHADYSMTCSGFATTVQRGAQWAATGQVTLQIPDDFPGTNKVTVRDLKN